MSQLESLTSGALAETVARPTQDQCPWLAGAARASGRGCRRCCRRLRVVAFLGSWHDLSRLASWGWPWLARPLASKGETRQECVRKCAGTARKGRFKRLNRHTAQGRSRRSGPIQADSGTRRIWPRLPC